MQQWREGGDDQERLHEWLPTVGLGALVGWHGLRVYLAKPWLEE